MKCIVCTAESGGHDMCTPCADMAEGAATTPFGVGWSDE